jgi:Reeler domain
MQIKHTFLFTFIVGLIWTGYVFAYVTGPDPAFNGVFGTGQTCNASGCHTGNPLNAAGGSLTIDGLPTASGWTPGQTYPITITIQRTGQRLFGFQLSAVADATNQQAGALAAGSGRVKVICGGGTQATSTITTSCSTPNAIQYAEHTNAAVVTNTYSVNWTAPASAAVGTIRFNVAGNAANGDGNNTGDFIYVGAPIRIDPAAAPPPPPDLTTRAFTLVDRGGVSVITDGSGDLSVGYARIQPASGNTTPSGVGIFGLRQGGVVVTEAGVPTSVRLTSARIYAEVTATVNTGLAIANPNDQPATINFIFTDATGADFGGGSLIIGPNRQIANFLHEAPFNVLAGRNPFQGTFSFTSDVEVSVIALRGLFNERTPSEFLLTTLPITNLSAPAGTGTVYLSHFADGGGWTTQIVLVNAAATALTGTIQFFGEGTATVAGAPLTVTAGGQTATSFNYSIPPKTSFKLATAGVLPATVKGSVRVTPSGGTAAPSALAIFSFKQGGITVSEAGVPGIQGSAFRMYGEETATGGVGAIQTGFAIANLAAAAANVTLELTGLDGASTGQVATVSVPGNGQIAKFLHEVFPGLSFPFRGILRISGGAAEGLSVVGLRGRYNERGDFLVTTTPPTDEGSPASGAELLFPHLVNGGGYTTQFILFSGTAGQASTGNMKFFKQDGTPLSLTVN